MATYTFPADVFTVEGDPEGVRESGRAYGRFASVAGEAAATLGGLDSGGWVGSEGDLFRTRVAELPPHLVTAHSAFGQVARALDDFAEVLASAQRRMAGARDQAEQTFGSLAGARADRAGLEEPTGTEAADPLVAAAFQERRGALEARIGRLETTWDEQLVAAAGIRAQVLEAARRGAAAIRAAGRTSPTADQNWFQDGWEKTKRWGSQRLDDLKGFMAEHASGLRLAAEALRWVGIALVAVGAVLAVLSFVAGLFSFGIGWLGELPAGLILQTGFLLWGTGEALDTTVDWAEGRIPGQQLLAGAGMSIGLSFGGARLVRPVLASAQGLVSKLQQWLRQVVPASHTGQRAVEGWAEALRRRLPGESWTDPNGGWRLRVDGGDVLSLDPLANAATDAFLDRARAAEPGITSLMEDISSHLDQAELVGLADRLKTQDSLKRALATEIQRRPFLDPTDVVEKNQDSVRYTVQLPPGRGYAAGVAEAVAQLRGSGAANLSWRWSWAGDGYKGINSSWRDPVSGHVFEVQFHTPDSFHAKSVTHNLYEQQRLPTTPPEEAARLAEEQSEIFRKVPVPLGVEDLIDRPQ